MSNWLGRQGNNKSHRIQAAYPVRIASALFLQLKNVISPILGRFLQEATRPDKWVATWRKEILHPVPERIYSPWKNIHESTVFAGQHSWPNDSGKRQTRAIGRTKSLPLSYGRAMSVVSVLALPSLPCALKSKIQYTYGLRGMITEHWEGFVWRAVLKWHFLPFSAE